MAKAIQEIEQRLEQATKPQSLLPEEKVFLHPTSATPIAERLVQQRIQDRLSLSQGGVLATPASDSLAQLRLRTVHSKKHKLEKKLIGQ